MEPPMVAFDIETTNLKANFGRVIVACVLDLYSGELKIFRGDDKRYTKEPISKDSKLVSDIVEALENSWLWISWYGKQFDIPYLNTRHQLMNGKYINRKLHADLLYYTRKPFMCLNNSKLDTVAKTFEIVSQKVDSCIGISFSYW